MPRAVAISKQTCEDSFTSSIAKTPVFGSLLLIICSQIRRSGGTKCQLLDHKKDRKSPACTSQITRRIVSRLLLDHKKDCKSPASRSQEGSQVDYFYITRRIVSRLLLDHKKDRKSITSRSQEGSQVDYFYITRRIVSRLLLVRSQEGL
jgi:hypothetical protein